MNRRSELGQARERAVWHVCHLETFMFSDTTALWIHSLTMGKWPLYRTNNCWWNFRENYACNVAFSYKCGQLDTPYDSSKYRTVLDKSRSLVLEWLGVCHLTQMNFLPFLSSIYLCFYQYNGLKPLPFLDRGILRMLTAAHYLMSLGSALLFKPYNIYYIVIHNICYVVLFYTNVGIRFSSFLRNDLVIYIWQVFSSLEYRCSYSAACMGVG
jgi:hypothetical protein